MIRALHEIDTLVIHHAKTPDGSDRYDVADLDAWHRERGFHRDPDAIAVHEPHLRHIGYHWVIPVDGRLVAGRSEWEVGAHAKGINRSSIGLCLLGTDRFSWAQWLELRRFVAIWLGSPLAQRRVIGHRHHNPAKACPGFDVRLWLAGGMAPLQDHLLS